MAFVRIPRNAMKPFLGKDEKSMKHNLSISVSRKPKDGGVVSCRRLAIRERLLRRLLGEKRSVTVIVPDDTVECVSITELPDGGDDAVEN